MSRAGWELLFMMVILKIPIAYLGFVVWYAIKAEPEPGVDPSEYSIWRPWKRRGGPPRRGSPHEPRTDRRARRTRRARVSS